MSLYRIKQFYWSITSKITEEDRIFLKKYLKDKEIELFKKLTVADQKHCIKVAKEIKQYYEKNSIKDTSMIKIGLMHDIGKIHKPLSPIDKSIMVLLDSITKGKVKRFNNIKKIDVYYNHGEKGYIILKEIGYDEYYLDIVKNHHNNNIKGDEKLNLLIKCDSNN